MKSGLLFGVFALILFAARAASAGEFDLAQPFSSRNDNEFYWVHRSDIKQGVDYRLENGKVVPLSPKLVPFKNSLTMPVLGQNSEPAPLSVFGERSPAKAAESFQFASDNNLPGAATAR